MRGVTGVKHLHMVCVGVVPVMTSVAFRLCVRVWLMCLGLLLLTQFAVAGNFTLAWGTAPYTWTASSLGPNTYTVTDQYGFQIQLRFTITQANGVSAGAFPDDLTTDGAGNTFGTQRSIWQVWNPNLTGGGIGGSTNVATLNVLNTAGVAVGVNGLNFRLSDVDAVDSNNPSFTNDRCDHVTITGNAGNPALSAATGSPTFLLGPGAGAGASPALAANQAQCNFQVSTAVTSATSNADDNGTLIATFPNGTSTAIVNYDESIHNVSGITTVNALARGIGAWSGIAFSANSTITLDKQAVTTGFTAVGNTVNYNYVVTNNGPLPLLTTQNVVVQDNKIASVVCPAIPAAGIAVGGTLTCTGSYIVVAADVTAGLVTNIATAGVGVGAQTFATRLQSNSDTETVRRYATLTLVKTVTNDNGGTAATSAFTLSAAGTTSISGVSGNASVTNVSVVPGTYALSETNVTGYVASAWSCTSGTLSGSSLTLTSGQSATCTINNNDVQPRLTLVKTVTNDNGGLATTTSVTLSATGPTNISGVSGAGAVTNAGVNAGTYALAETALAGYTASAWSCTAGTLSGSNLTLNVGQTASCTINNNDIGPVLTLIKTVTDTSGGPSTVSSFTLTATGPVVISGITGAASVTSATINAGTYALSETNLAGYTAGAWACTAGTLSGSNLTLALAQTSSCTINNIKLPTLTLQKISNGGTGAFDFSGTNGVPTQTISTTAVGSTFSGTTATLTTQATATAITEAMPATFWEIQAASCTGMGTGGTATLSGNTLTLDPAATAAGRNITCTFTNRRRPTVAVQKITTGAAGGAFSFATSNLTGSVANITTTVTNTPTPASPTKLIATTIGSAVGITETSPITFVPSGATCTDANSAISGNSNPVATSSTVAVTIPAAAIRIGADITCVYTNAAAAPQLTITKTPNTAGPVNVGNVIGYTYRITNTGNVSVNNVTINDVHGGYGVDPVPGSESLFNDVAPLGDSTDAAANGTWTSIAPGDTIQFTSNYTVVQADIDNLQ
jgi:uncharacterized repeat protein (TIGR01451 family)